MVAKSRRSTPAIVLAALMAATAAWAVLPPLSPEQRDAAASLVVTGTVASSTTSDVGAAESIDEITDLTVQVEAVERGSGASAGQEISVRCWTVVKRPPGWVGPTGVNPLPKIGDRIRVWLVPDGDGDGDGGWKPLEPNGVEILGPAPVSQSSQAPVS